MTRLILITEPAFEAVLAAPLAAAAPGLTIARASTRLELEGLLMFPEPTRVLSIGADFIVPKRILDDLAGPAYNLHPGPPEYPGLFPSVFALYDGATSFGVTLHEMAARVDSGPIVAVDRFAVPIGCDRLALDTLAFAAMRAMITRLAPALVDLTRPLPQAGAAWSGVTRTRTDFNALCRLPDDCSAEEFDRRLRAVGEGPHHALTVTRFGRRFQLVGGAGAVVRAGERV